jgi:hypothetical protein
MKKIAGYGLLTLFSLIIIFHLLVIIQIIPYEIVWGGRLTSLQQMYVSESISVALNLLFLVIVMVNTKFLNWQIPPKVITIFLWLMFALFVLNTLGNLLSVNSLEKMIFTPITILLSVFCLILALPKKQDSSE